MAFCYYSFAVTGLSTIPFKFSKLKTLVSQLHKPEFSWLDYPGFGVWETRVWNCTGKCIALWCHCHIHHISITRAI